ncbi:hypothetical protein CIB95_08605 [Lottiidibacillus patelloidae]|uniref:Lipoprotein YerB n=1 Tax=Lottiidibacillus patelloidae TaxID=2670334 RepID=A0A263BTQ3_9BACI|nr:DUF3048 domain-containing protein [Lottiidibacillus patelloidae]OZM57089.1 hypothetical protein CIB95_08605 [Lottiidibacillus patelloidae]
MKRILFIIIFTLFALTACSNGEKNNEELSSPDPVITDENENANDESTDEEEVVEVVEEVEESLPYVYPLTGIRTDQDISQRVIAVMLNNHVKARPQSGLHKADVVYEVLAEGNITRFLALYQSDLPEVFGPIRSARHYYMDLSNGYNGFYIHHGWSPLAKKMVKNGQIENLNGLYFDGILFHRAPFRKAPHNSYITVENLMEGADRKGYAFEDTDISPLPFLTEDEVASLSGEKATSVTVTYASSYDVKYEYNAEEMTYTRYSSGVKTVDLETEIPITTKNIFVVEVPHYFIDSYPRRGLSLTDGGKGYLIGNGIVREVEWQNVDGRILPFHDGKEVGFIPGKTWINIVPTDPGLEDSVTIVGNE